MRIVRFSPTLDGIGLNRRLLPQAHGKLDIVEQCIEVDVSNTNVYKSFQSHDIASEVKCIIKSDQNPG